MREFFQRHQVRLAVGDLHRFAKILIEDLSVILRDYELIVRLFDAPEREDELAPEIRKSLAQNRVSIEEGSGRLHIPIVHQDRALALISAMPPGNQALEQAVRELLPEFVRLSLDKILLYKINITDRETGLNNEYYFRTYLSKNLMEPSRPGGVSGRGKLLSFSDLEEHPGLTVMLAEITDFDKLTAHYGRLEAAHSLTTLARWLQESLAGPMRRARLERGRLGLILPREDITACEKAVRKVLARLAGEDGRNLPALKVAFGLASFPLDVTEAFSQGDSEAQPSDRPADLLLARAELALSHALNHDDDPVFTFREVLQRGGQVIQVLPYNRVVVNLGRVAGAREGHTFILGEADRDSQAGYKGEVVLFDVAQDFSLGEVLNLSSSLSRACPGDPLLFSRHRLKQSPADELTDEDSQDRLLGILNHQGFMSQLNKCLSEKEAPEAGFTVTLIRVDGYDRYRTTMGHIESDRHFKALYHLITEDLAENCLIGRFSADSLCLFQPDLSPEKGLAQAKIWCGRVVRRLRQTASFGVAYYPCGAFDPQDIVSNAQKALEHASFFGPASTALFDSVSLNISGDKLFEAGDRDGAIEEYQKALQLNPLDLNVLNSLGGCYGYQKQMVLAMETFARVLNHDPDNLMAHYNKGFVLAMDDRPREALENFRRAVSLDPDNFDVLFQLGKTALDLDLIEEALDVFKRAARLKNHRPVVFRYLGQTLLKAERLDEALDAFKAAVRYDPDDASSLSQLGVLYMERATDADVALSLHKQSVALDPANILFRQRLARALAQAAKPVSAEMEYRSVLDMGVKSREIFFELGQVILEQGRLEEARDFYEKSLRLDPGFRQALEALTHLESANINTY